MRRSIRVLGSAAALLCAVWLLVAGFSKLDDTARFQRALRVHGVVPARFIPPATFGVPVGELACGICAITLVIHRRQRGALIVTGAAFLTFGAYAVLLVRWAPPPSPCGCSPSDHLVSSWAPIALKNLGLATGLALLGAMTLPDDRTRTPR